MSNNTVNGLNINANRSSKKDFPEAPETFIPAISFLQFPFTLKKDQIDAVDAWIGNNYRGTVLYSTGTGKTEIAFECAKRFLDRNKSPFLGYYKNIITTTKNVDPMPSNVGPAGSSYIPENIENNNMEKDRLHSDNVNYSFLNILFLVPRISLIDQTVNRLLSYGIPKEKVGAYFGERKETREIIISTYQSVVRNLKLIRRSNMVIFDEVHLIRDTAKSFSKIFDTVVEDPKKAILGLTATLNEHDFRNSTVLAVLPPIKRYPIRKAVSDKRLAKPVVIPIKVNLTEKESKEYDVFSTKIKNISNRFKRYDVSSMTELLKKGGFASGMAKAWFSNVRKRKLLLSYAENKLSAAADIVSKKFPEEKIMVFSETIESIEKLRDILKIQGINAKIIDAKVKTLERQKILDKWGKEFNILLSLHTLEIGYNVPQVRIEIIMATTSNINQIIQRIGRVLRKHEGKDVALIYVIYVSDTKDDNVIEIVKKAIENDTDNGNQDSNREEQLRKVNQKDKAKVMAKKGFMEKEFTEKRIEKAYGIIESKLLEPNILAQNVEDRNEESNLNTHNEKSKAKIYIVKSKKDKNKFYKVDIENKTCTCADFLFRHVKCKHIIATEFVLP
jgi:superfamily II DNA or RNA helicase